MKIVKAAIKLFNEQGTVNVLNQEVANSAGISLSNFNYHFKTKKELIYAVCIHMNQIIEEQVAANRVLTTEGNGLDLARICFEFANEFRFFYLDTYNILQKYPKLKPEIHRQMNEAIQIYKNLNYLAVGKGLMKPEPPEFAGLYDSLAKQIWQTVHFWLAQSNIRGAAEVDVVECLEEYFAICFPYLTEKGQESYRAFIEKVRSEEIENKKS